MTSHVTPLTHRAAPEIEATAQRRAVRIASASLVAALVIGVAAWAFRPHAAAPLAVLLVPDAAIVTDQSRKLLMVVAADGSVTPRPSRPARSPTTSCASSRADSSRPTR